MGEVIPFRPRRATIENHTVDVTPPGPLAYSNAKGTARRVHAVQSCELIRQIGPVRGGYLPWFACGATLVGSNIQFVDSIENAPRRYSMCPRCASGVIVRRPW